MQRGEALEGFHVPHAHGLVVGAAEHTAAGVDQGAHRAAVPLERVDALQLGDVPHLAHRIIGPVKDDVRDCFIRVLKWIG